MLVLALKKKAPVSLLCKHRLLQLIPNFHRKYYSLVKKDGSSRQYAHLLAQLTNVLTVLRSNQDSQIS